MITHIHKEIVQKKNKIVKSVNNLNVYQKNRQMNFNIIIY